MMRYSYHCHNNLHIAALQSAPILNAKPFSDSAFMSRPFDSSSIVKIKPDSDRPLCMSIPHHM